jgi:hypothetical protein
VRGTTESLTYRGGRLRDGVLSGSLKEGETLGTASVPLKDGETLGAPGFASISINFMMIVWAEVKVE